MAKKGIVELFDELESFVENCPSQKFSSNKIIVPRDEILHDIREIKMKIPSEVEHSNKVVENRDSILADARRKADELIQLGQNEAQRRVSQSEIMRMANEQAQELLNNAQARAQEIVNQASKEGDMIRMGALHYTNNVMKDLSDFTASFLEEEGAKYQILVQTLQEQYKTIETNRSQIASQLESGVAPSDDGRGAATKPPKRQMSEVEKLHQGTRDTAANQASAARVNAKVASATAGNAAVHDKQAEAIAPAKAAAAAKPATPENEFPMDDELDELDELYLDRY